MSSDSQYLALTSFSSKSNQQTSALSRLICSISQGGTSQMVIFHHWQVNLVSRSWCNTYSVSMSDVFQPVPAAQNACTTCGFARAVQLSLGWRLLSLPSLTGALLMLFLRVPVLKECQLDRHNRQQTALHQKSSPKCGWKWLAFVRFTFNTFKDMWWWWMDDMTARSDWPKDNSACNIIKPLSACSEISLSETMADFHDTAKSQLINPTLSTETPFLCHKKDWLSNAYIYLTKWLLSSFLIRFSSFI